MPEDVAFIAVTDDSGRNVARLVQQQEITLPICLDPESELKDAYRVSNIPAVFVIDASGKVRDHFVRLQSPETLREAILKAGAKPLASVAD